jgi:hypothetical protein
MADEWYCEIAGREIGPLSSGQLRVMAAKGQILSNDCVRQGAQGSWILARQVKGLLPAAGGLAGAAAERTASLSKSATMLSRDASAKQELANGSRARQVVGPEALPVAERLPRASAIPSSSSHPLSPADPPSVPDVFDPVALGILDDPADMKAASQSHATSVRSRERRRRLERQKIFVGVLAAAILALAITGLLLALGGRTSQADRNASAAPAKKTPAARPAASPEALEAREGIERLDSPASKPHKMSVDAPKKPIATGSNQVKTAAASGSSKTIPPKPKKPREPKPGTPEADFGLPMVDD